MDTLYPIVGSLVKIPRIAGWRKDFGLTGNPNLALYSSNVTSGNPRLANILFKAPTLTLTSSNNVPFQSQTTLSCVMSLFFFY